MVPLRRDQNTPLHPKPGINLPSSSTLESNHPSTYTKDLKLQVTRYQLQATLQQRLLVILHLSRQAIMGLRHPIVNLFCSKFMRYHLTMSFVTVEVYLPSASGPRPSIIKPSFQSPVKTIYVTTSGGNGAASNGPFKTFLVTNTNPVQVQHIGYANPTTASLDLDTAASSPILSQLQSQLPPETQPTSIQKAKVIHEHEQMGSESRILPSSPFNILRAFRDVREDEPSSMENVSVNVPLSLIVPTSTESVEVPATTVPTSTEQSPTTGH